jgi:hypothetical protein
MDDNVIQCAKEHFLSNQSILMHRECSTFRSAAPTFDIVDIATQLCFDTARKSLLRDELESSVQIYEKAQEIFQSKESQKAFESYLSFKSNFSFAPVFYKVGFF